MKKNLKYIGIIGCICLIITGCLPNKVVKNPGSDINEKDAQKMIKFYIESLSIKDYANCKKYLSDNLSQKVKFDQTDYLNINGYKIVESTETGKEIFIKVCIDNVDYNKPYATLNEYTFKVIKQNSEYKIDEISISPKKEVFDEKNLLRVRDKDDVKSGLLIDLSGLPEFYHSQDDVSLLYKTPIPKERFDIINICYDGDSIALSTVDADSCFIGITNVDEAETVQGNNNGDGSGNGESKGQGASKGGSLSNIKETPLGKNLIPLDIIKNAKVQFFIFSLDEKFLICQYKTMDERICMRIYSIDEGKLIPFKYEENYNISNVDIKYLSQEGDIIYYQVIPLEGKENEESQVAGNWEINLKDFKVKRQ